MMIFMLNSPMNYYYEVFLVWIVACKAFSNASVTKGDYSFVHDK